MPKLTVITRKAYGGAYDVMSSKVGGAAGSHLESCWVKVPQLDLHNRQKCRAYGCAMLLSQAATSACLAMHRPPCRSCLPRAAPARRHQPVVAHRRDCGDGQQGRS